MVVLLLLLGLMRLPLDTCRSLIFIMLPLDVLRLSRSLLIRLTRNLVSLWLRQLPPLRLARLMRASRTRGLEV